MWVPSPGGGHGNPSQSSCLENLHGQSSLMGYSPWSHKESDMPEATQHACTQSGPCSGICLPLKLMTADCLGLHLSSPERRRAPESQMPEPHRVSVMDSYIQGLGLGLNHSSVQFSHSVVSDSLRPHESQHASPPCPSPTPRVHSNSCPSSQ